MILAVIPARGGSKGIPGKNIKDLYGQPLISYTSMGRMFHFYVRQHWQWIPRKRLMRL